MSDIYTAVTEGIQFWQIAAAGMTFALLFASVFLVSRRLCDDTLKRDVPGIAQRHGCFYWRSCVRQQSIPCTSIYSMKSFGIIDAGLCMTLISLRCQFQPGPVMAST